MYFRSHEFSLASMIALHCNTFNLVFRDSVLKLYVHIQRLNDVKKLFSDSVCNTSVCSLSCKYTYKEWNCSVKAINGTVANIENGLYSPSPVANLNVQFCDRRRRI